MTVRVAVFASGRGSNFEILADAHARTTDPPWKVVLLVTDRPAAGALDAADRRGIPGVVEEPGGDPVDFAERLLARLAAAGTEVVLLAGFLRLMPGPVVARYRGRMLNLHPALLPGFGGKGMYGRRVHEAVLAAGVRVSGATVHFVDEAYDRGPILAQWPVPVPASDTPESLEARIRTVEHRLYPAAVDALVRSLREDGDPPGIPSHPGHFHLSDQAPAPS